MSHDYPRESDPPELPGVTHVVVNPIDGSETWTTEGLFLFEVLPAGEWPKFWENLGSTFRGEELE